MINKTYKWYLIYSVTLSIYGLLFFVLNLDLVNLGRAFAEGWSFIIFGPLVLLQLPLLIFNLIIFIIFIFRKVERVALVLPGAFVVYHLMYSAVPDIVSSETVYFHFVELALLATTLSISIKFIGSKD